MFAVTANVDDVCFSLALAGVAGAWFIWTGCIYMNNRVRQAIPNQTG